MPDRAASAPTRSSGHPAPAARGRSTSTLTVDGGPPAAEVVRADRPARRAGPRRVAATPRRSDSMRMRPGGRQRRPPKTPDGIPANL